MKRLDLAVQGIVAAVVGSANASAEDTTCPPSKIIGSGAHAAVQAGSKIIGNGVQPGGPIQSSSKDGRRIEPCNDPPHMASKIIGNGDKAGGNGSNNLQW